MPTGTIFFNAGRVDSGARVPTQQPSSSPTNAPTSLADPIIVPISIDYRIQYTSDPRAATDAELTGLLEQTALFYTEVLTASFPGAFNSLETTFVSQTLNVNDFYQLGVKFNVVAVFATGKVSK